MEDIKKIDWNLAWEIVKDIVLPHSGTLIFNVVLFIIIGLLLSIGYTIFLSKKRIFKRKPQYYNWAVKLYIPLIIVAFLYVFGQIGFIRGIYNIISKEKEPIVTSIYTKTLGVAFESEESKNTFVKEIQIAAKDAKDGSNAVISQLKEASANYNTGVTLIDTGKNKVSTYLIDKYGNDIYKMGTYGMLNLAAAKAQVNVNETLPYEEFSKAMDFLMDADHAAIELAVKDKLMIWFESLLDAQYHSLVKSLLFLLLGVMILPLIEYFIYKKWIEPKYIKNEIASPDEEC